MRNAVSIRFFMLAVGVLSSLPGPLRGVEEDPFGVPSEEALAAHALSKSPPARPTPAIEGDAPVSDLDITVEMPAVPGLDDYRSVATPAEAQVFEGFLGAAEGGDVEAMYRVGRCYAEGKGVAPNESKALEWYERAAKKLHVNAAFKAGYCYYHARGTAKDLRQASHYYSLASMEGHAQAMFELGCINYESFEGLPPDPRNAMGWFKQSAKLGFSEAMYRLARGYGRGDGLAQNDKLACAWMLQAALRGHKLAPYCLGNMYEVGKGTPKDIKNANLWYAEAARREDPNGLGVVEKLKAKGFDWTKAGLPDLLNAAKQGTFPPMPE